MVDGSDFDFSMITEANTVFPINAFSPATGVDGYFIPEEFHESRQVIQKGARCHAMQRLPFSEVPKVQY